MTDRVDEIIAKHKADLQAVIDDAARNVPDSVRQELADLHKQRDRLTDRINQLQASLGAELVRKAQNELSRIDRKRERPTTPPISNPIRSTIPERRY